MQAEDVLRLPTRAFSGQSDTFLLLTEKRSKFQWMVNQLIGHLEYVRGYLDDLEIFPKKFPDYLEHLPTVIELISCNCLKLKV